MKNQKLVRLSLKSKFSNKIFKIFFVKHIKTVIWKNYDEKNKKKTIEKIQSCIF